MARRRTRTSLVALASAALVAASLWTVPGAGASEQPNPDPSSTETSDPGPGEEPSTEPTPSPTPSPDLSPSPGPAPSPSLSPSPGGSETTEPETPSESTEPSASPSESASPSPSNEPEEGAVDEYIVVVRNGAYIDSVKTKAEEIGGQSKKELRGAVDGFTATLTTKDAEDLEADPNVRFVEKDELIRLNAASFQTIENPITLGNLSNCDDCSSAAFDIGFTVDWFGTEYSKIIINSNGGAVLDDGMGRFSAYSGINLTTATRPYILPLFTDLNPASGGTVEFGTGKLDSGTTNVFWVEWENVKQFGDSVTEQTFQMLISQPTAGGDTDVEFRYVDIAASNSTINRTFEVGYTDGGSNDVRIAASTSTPSTVATDLLDGRGNDGTGVWTYTISASGSPSPAPTPTPTPDPVDSVQPNATWGLDRIDQRSLPLDSSYGYPADGSGTTIYVIDTGVLTSHDEFSGRVSSGYDFVDDDSNPTDCDGHGTHVAGTAMGTTYGVAKGANVSGVRVLDCSGSGWTSDVVAGMNWVRNNHATVGGGGRGVVNMSLGSYGSSKSMSDAVNNLVNAGIPVVVAAGNSNDDASLYSPAGVPAAITVGATESDDDRSYFSNYGSTVDIFAPGTSITSAWHTSNVASNTISGTSMASPHVAGAVALYLELNPSATPAQVATGLANAATTDVVDNPGTGSPNRLLYVRSFTGDGGSGGDSGGDSGGGSGGGGSSGGGSGGGGSSGGGSGGGGGGGLNEITAVSPTNAGAPGAVVAFTGWGLTTTRAVNFNDYPAQFTVVNDGHLEVTVPNIPPGVYVVHAVLAPTVGRASYWEGFSVQPRGAVNTTPSPGGSPSIGKPEEPIQAATSAAEFVSFKGNQTKMTRATRSKLAEVARDFIKPKDQAVIVTYTNKKETKKSVRRAEKRANNMRRYLIRAGFQGAITMRTEPGDTKAQRRGAMVYVQPEGIEQDDQSEGVTSLIIRTKKGRTPTVDGQVRGADNVSQDWADLLSIGRSLGLRMYRIDLAQPVSEQVAEQVAADLMEDPGIAFAEPDSIVSTQVSITS